jgi:hypothetical protein
VDRPSLIKRTLLPMSRGSLGASLCGSLYTLGQQNVQNRSSPAYATKSSEPAEFGAFGLTQTPADARIHARFDLSRRSRPFEIRSALYTDTPSDSGGPVQVVEVDLLTALAQRVYMRGAVRTEPLSRTA